MTELNISSVLSQIRALREQAQRVQSPLAPKVGIGAPAAKPVSFSETLSGAVNKVAEMQNQATRMQTAFELGDPKADLTQTMIAMQKSQVAFRGLVEVRNRAVQAYQDIMNMPM